jgi:NTE family protein
MEIALALGSGGIKGIAHIGVIRTLEREGFVIRAIAGASAGAIVGSAYAAGYSVDQIEIFLNQVNNTDRSVLLSRNPNDGPSLLGVNGFTETLTNLLGDKTFEELKIPFACTAVDLNSGQEYFMHKGRVIDCVLASSAIPGILPPRTLGGATLVDGAVLDPVPVALARWLAPTLPVVAVCLTPTPEKWVPFTSVNMIPATPLSKPIINQFAKLRIAQAFDVFINSMDISSQMLSELRLQVDKPEVIIRPDVFHIGLLDRIDPHDLVKAGEEATQQNLLNIKQALSWTNQIYRRLRKAPLPAKPLEENGFSTPLNSIE